MNELQIFENSEFGQVRTVDVDGKTYFVANDVARALGYKRPADAVTAHCKGSVKYRHLTDGGEQELKIIPEGDIYRLVIKSQLPSAERFEKWVFDDVIPSKIPVLNIKMMSDEEWNELAIQNAIENYTKEFGHYPEHPEDACKWQRERVQNILRELGEVA